MQQPYKNTNPNLKNKTIMDADKKLELLLEWVRSERQRAYDKMPECEVTDGYRWALDDVLQKILSLN